MPQADTVRRASAAIPTTRIMATIIAVTAITTIPSALVSSAAPITTTIIPGPMSRIATCAACASIITGCYAAIAIEQPARPERFSTAGGAAQAPPASHFGRYCRKTGAEFR